MVFDFPQHYNYPTGFAFCSVPTNYKLCEENSFFYLSLLLSLFFLISHFSRLSLFLSPLIMISLFVHLLQTSRYHSKWAILNSLMRVDRSFVIWKPSEFTKLSDINILILCLHFTVNYVVKRITNRFAIKAKCTISQKSAESFLASLINLFGDAKKKPLVI